MQSLLKTAEHLKIKGLCEVNDQCDNPLEYFNYNPRQAHTQSQQYLSTTSTTSRHPSLIPSGHHSKSSQNRFGETVSSGSNKRLHNTPTKGRKSPRLTSTPDTAKGDGQLISSDTETGEQEQRGRDKGKMASLGMGMVSFFIHFLSAQVLIESLIACV